VKKSLVERDKIDAQNTYKLPDSVIVDTTNLTIEEQIGVVVNLAMDIV
jgi:cytidylate kinase